MKSHGPCHCWAACSSSCRWWMTRVPRFARPRCRRCDMPMRSVNTRPMPTGCCSAWRMTGSVPASCWRGCCPRAIAGCRCSPTRAGRAGRAGRGQPGAHRWRNRGWRRSRHGWRTVCRRRARLHARVRRTWAMSLDADAGSWRAVAGHRAGRDQGRRRLAGHRRQAPWFPDHRQATEAALEGLDRELQSQPQMLSWLRRLQAVPEPVVDAEERAALASSVAAAAAVQLAAEAGVPAARPGRSLRSGGRGATGIDRHGHAHRACRCGRRCACATSWWMNSRTPRRTSWIWCEALTSGWDDEVQRSLFLVGDPMQSIYLFRNSEVGLFLRTRAEGVGLVRLEALRLGRNFRSVPRLVDWANAAFARIFPAVEDLRSSAVLPFSKRRPRGQMKAAAMPYASGRSPAPIRRSKPRRSPRRSCSCAGSIRSGASRCWCRRGPWRRRCWRSLRWPECRRWAWSWPRWPIGRWCAT